MSTTSPPYFSCSFRLFNSIHQDNVIMWISNDNDRVKIWCKRSNWCVTLQVNPLGCGLLWRCWWRKPDICVELFVQRFHLVIQGHHLSLKVGCLISGEFKITSINQIIWDIKSYSRYKKLKVNQSKLFDLIKIQSQTFLSTDLPSQRSHLFSPVCSSVRHIADTTALSILVYIAEQLYCSLDCWQKYLIFWPTIRRHSPQTHFLQTSFSFFYRISWR